MSWEIRVGDALERLRELADASVDAVVTDPPYGIGFMGHEWDQPGEHGRASNPKPSGFSVHPTEKAKKLGQRAVSRDRPGAMEAGRYDLSLSANQRFQEWCEAWARELLRVLKPGGHCLVFGGTRTYHRLTSGLEDAGFEIRDCLMWLYGSGFPKSLNLDGEWEGWGTALKPSWEPVVVARKPYVGTVAGNVLEHGTGALNVDGCRVGWAGAADELESKQKNRHGDFDSAPRNDGTKGIYGADLRGGAERGNYDPTGRWPANVVLAHDEDCVLVGQEQVRADDHFPAARGASGYGSSVSDSNGGGLKGQEDLEERHFDGELVERWACVPGCPVRMLDDQTGELASGTPGTMRLGENRGAAFGAESRPPGTPMTGFGDRGGPSRFYYCAKASRAEREAGLDGFEKKDLLWSSGTENPGSFQSEGTDRSARNHHPTVKPIDLMRWLVRLVTPPGGLVVDCFAGSGTTGCAAALEGFAFVGIERQEDYAEIARARIAFWVEHPTGLPVDVALQAEGRRRRVRESGQLGLGRLADKSVIIPVVRESDRRRQKWVRERAVRGLRCRVRSTRLRRSMR